MCSTKQQALSYGNVIFRNVDIHWKGHTMLKLRRPQLLLTYVCPAKWEIISRTQTKKTQNYCFVYKDIEELKLE